jgi:hypothetical protein
MNNNQNQLDFKEVQPGHIFSETSIYTVENVSPDGAVLKHHASGQKVQLSKEYITNLLVSADHTYEVVKIGKEDKVWTEKQIADAVKKGDLKTDEVKPGEFKTPGIKNVWSGIGNHVFTVTFQKKGKELSGRAFKTLIETKATEAAERLEQVKASKKGVKSAAEEIIKDLLENPVSKFEAGEMRTLRGFKMNHESEDGYYKVVDLDKTDDAMGGVRLVNINTIHELTYKGVTYVVE